MKVELSPKAEKQLDKLNRDPELQARLITAMEGLEESPFAGKPLEGEHKGCRSLRTGEWRIIYEADMSNEIVLIIRMGKRSEVYR